MVSETREPVTIELSVKEMVLAAVLVLCLVAASVYSVVNFRQLRSEHQQLASSAQILREQLAARAARVDSLRQQVEQNRGAVLVVGQNNDTTMVSPGSYSERMVIEDLKVEPENDSLLVSFRLVNNGQDEQLAAGYLVLLAEHDSGDLRRYGSFPNLDIMPGNALNYSSGDSYAIRRFKFVEAAIPLEDVMSHYKRLKVLVFDNSGELLLYQDLRLKV
jgi:hypothetical protein